MMSPGPSSCHHLKRTLTNFGMPLPLHVRCESTTCSAQTRYHASTAGCCKHHSLQYCLSLDALVASHGATIQQYVDVHVIRIGTCRLPHCFAMTPGGRDSAACCMMPWCAHGSGFSGAAVTVGEFVLFICITAMLQADQLRAPAAPCVRMGVHLGCCKFILEGRRACRR